MKKICIILSITLLTLSCQRQQMSRADTDVGDIREISLPRYQMDLPEGKGREIFAVACVSCHSPRYVTMQPLFTAAKWEEEVRKMIKNYGAPIAEEQVPVLVQYLVTTKEQQNAPAWNTLSVVQITDQPPALAI